MHDYLLIYQNGDPDWHETTTPEERAATMQAWGAWFQQLEGSGHLRNPGAALHPEGTALTKSADGFATDASMAEVKDLVGGYSVVAAPSLEEATELAQGCPFLDNNAAGRILVRRIMTAEEYE
ncbi:MAG: hypothetical protein GKS06_09365 [Acidobacteria bacterium]|nr:hypothetical protein [Acidobacteriota bacterium]